tara:strand:+ start:204 stop:548 length:345 start_codon:yes stop_codon:yes gene_type:complete
MWRIVTGPSHGPIKAMPISGRQPTGGQSKSLQIIIRNIWRRKPICRSETGSGYFFHDVETWMIVQFSAKSVFGEVGYGFLPQDRVEATTLAMSGTWRTSMQDTKSPLQNRTCLN